MTTLRERELILKRMPCGGMPIRDHESDWAYRCDTCFAVVGSVGMPPDCYEKWRAEKL